MKSSRETAPLLLKVTLKEANPSSVTVSPDARLSAMAVAQSSMMVFTEPAERPARGAM